MKLDVSELKALSDVPDFTATSPAHEFFVRYVFYVCIAPFNTHSHRITCRLSYDPSDSSLQSLPLQIPDEEGQYACAACAKAHEVDCNSQPQLTHTAALRFRTEQYKVDDFVYFDTNQATHASDASSSESLLGRPPAPSSRLLPIGKIRSILSADKLEVREYERTGTQVRAHQTSNFASGSDFTAQRCLTRTKRTRRVRTESLLGKCAVIPTDAWRARTDVQNGDVYGAEPTLYHTETTSSSQHAPRQPKRPRRDIGVTLSQSTPDLSHARPKLRMLDIFCGAGGMSQGWARAAVADIVCGIDVSPSACETFRLVLVLARTWSATETYLFRTSHPGKTGHSTFPTMLLMIYRCCGVL